MQKLIESSNVIIYLKDEEGRFLMVNQKLAELFQAPREEIIGKTDYDFASEEQADKWRAQDLKVAEAGTPINFKFTTSLPEGDFTILDHKFPVDVDGHPKAVGGIAIEITEVE